MSEDINLREKVIINSVRKSSELLDINIYNSLINTITELEESVYNNEDTIKKLTEELDRYREVIKKEIDIRYRWQYATSGLIVAYIGFNGYVYKNEIYNLFVYLFKVMS